MSPESINPSTDYVGKLLRRSNRSAEHLDTARRKATEVADSLRERLAEFSSDDYDAVAFGSLARREWTSGSDVDWTLLIDGQASPDHREIARRIDATISATMYDGAALKPPGQEGIFGEMTFSHDVIHHIGGQRDTNRNTTQRILMLVEAMPIRPFGLRASKGTYERVASAILDRYFHDETASWPYDDGSPRIPRFLLNDVVRYWRTMCVDFAYKGWERAGRGWGVRNVKLRTSRKLMFASAMLLAFDFYRRPLAIPKYASREEYIFAMHGRIRPFLNATPLDILAWTFSSIGLENDALEAILRYDEFLGAMNDSLLRKELEGLSPSAAYANENFLRIRDVSNQFQNALTQAFLVRDTQLREFTIAYGVF